MLDFIENGPILEKRVRFYEKRGPKNAVFGVTFGPRFWGLRDPQKRGPGTPKTGSKNLKNPLKSLRKTGVPGTPKSGSPGLNFRGSPGLKNMVRNEQFIDRTRILGFCPTNLPSKRPIKKMQKRCWL